MHLNALSFASFRQFTDNFLDEMTGYVPKNFEVILDEDVCDEVRNMLKDKLRSLFLHLVYASSPSKEDYSRILDSDKTEYIFEAFKTRKLDIARTLLKQHNMAIRPTLNNFDWKLRWIVGSSTCPTLRYPLLNLDLSTIESTGSTSKTNNFSVEMTKDELDSLILCLEKHSNKNSAPGLQFTVNVLN